jgi:multicomponent Na+:H+ antiporter subunit B
MTRNARTAVFLVFGLAVLALLVWGARGTAPFGHYPGPYGDVVTRDALSRRHATNAVTTVVMDIRAVDTAGEELILLAAAVGVLMLLRRQGEEEQAPIESVPGRPHALSEPVRTIAALLIGPVGILGMYVVIHGAITPGGGFQGGVILACPSLLLFFAANMRGFERFHPSAPWEFAQGLAITLFLAFGFAGMLLGRGFLQNILPRGVSATVPSAGTIPVLNMIVGPAVATAIVLVALELATQLTEFQP